MALPDTYPLASDWMPAKSRGLRDRALSLLPTRVYLELYRRRYQRSRPDYFADLQGLRHRTTQDGYSYKPFDDTRSIFVHVPKCAGVSVCKALYGNLAGGHTTLQKYLVVFEPKDLLRYFKFTIVRNPWDRTVSAYHYLKSGGLTERDRSWFDAELSGYMDFLDFVKRWLNAENVWKGYHFMPQCHFILERRGKVKLDFVARLETLSNDFKLIDDHLGNHGIHRTLPCRNKSLHGCYRDYYDDEAIEIVANVYREDIELLGYSF